VEPHCRGKGQHKKQKMKGKMVERKSIYFTDNLVSLSIFPVNFKFKGKVDPFSCTSFGFLMIYVALKEVN